MSRVLKMSLGCIAVFGFGVLASFVFGSAPPPTSSSPPSPSEWVVPASQALDIAVLDAKWEQSPPWPAPPKPVEDVAGALPAAAALPVAVPVGIAKGRRGPEAIFSVSGAGELRLPVGGRLPDGGRVTKVSRLGVEWIDADGEHHEHEMFNTYRVQELATNALPVTAAGRGLPAAPGQQTQRNAPQRGARPPAAQPQTKTGTEQRWPGRR